jgi:hypothetical protein
MKSIKIIFATILILFAFSCAKDDEVPPSLIGKWEIVKFNPFNNGVLQPDSALPFNFPNCQNTILEFKANNMLSFTFFNSANCMPQNREDNYINDGRVFYCNTPFPQSLCTMVTLSNTDLICDVQPAMFQPNSTTDFRQFRISCKRLP